MTYENESISNTNHIQVTTRACEGSAGTGVSREIGTGCGRGTTSNLGAYSEAGVHLYFIYKRSGVHVLVRLAR